MNYKDELRGKITNPSRKRQLFDFSGLKYGRITGTDIDLFFEIHNEIFCIYEFKYIDPDRPTVKAQMPGGQQRALTNLIDGLRDGNRKAVLFVCYHHEKDVETEVDAAKCIVEEYYYNGHWYNAHDRNAKDMTDSFIKFCEISDFITA